jgi:hypothetical protein
MAAEDKNTRLKSNMTIAILPGVGRFGACRRLVCSALESDVDIYTIIFATLAVVVCLCLYSVIGQRTGSERPFRVSAFTYREMSRSLLNYVGPTLPSDCYAALVTWATGLIAMRSC